MSDAGGFDTIDIENQPEPTTSTAANAAAAEPDVAGTTTTTNPHNPYHRTYTHKKWKLLFLSTFLIAAVVIAIALGVTLGNKNDGDGASTTTSSANSNIDTTAVSQEDDNALLPVDGDSNDFTDTGALTDPTDPASTAATDPASTVTESAPYPAWTAAELTSSQFLKPNGQLISKIRMINPTITNGYEVSLCHAQEGQCSYYLIY